LQVVSDWLRRSKGSYRLRPIYRLYFDKSGDYTYGKKEQRIFEIMAEIRQILGKGINP
jgi:hypothetical protein